MYKFLCGCVFSFLLSFFLGGVMFIYLFGCTGGS